MCPKTFPIAPHFCTIFLGYNSTTCMYITCKGGDSKVSMTMLLIWGGKPTYVPETLVNGPKKVVGAPPYILGEPAPTLVP
jgi:hypothetical protein